MESFGQQKPSNTEPLDLEPPVLTPMTYHLPVMGIAARRGKDAEEV